MIGVIPVRRTTRTSQLESTRAAASGAVPTTLCRWDSTVRNFSDPRHKVAGGSNRLTASYLADQTLLLMTQGHEGQ
jgi:hypothetical protein